MTIGVFDSGVGGLSVLRAIRQVLPHAPLVYVADQAYVPYGTRPPEEVRARSETITQFLLAQGASLIVVACNTATAAALTYLRQAYPAVPFVGMEPAIKPAVQLTHTAVVGVLATANTFQSQRYASLLARYAQGVTLLENPCLGLVEAIERGETHTAVTRTLLREIVEPMLAQKADTLILGCTHYPFVQDVLVDIVGEAVTIIDPATAVARQVARLYPHSPPPPHHTATTHFYTSGDPAHLQQALYNLLNWSSTTVQPFPSTTTPA